MATEMLIAERVADVRARIATACLKAGRMPSQVRLLPVSKTQPVTAIRALWQATGITRFAENKVQELVAKETAFGSDSPLTWALIGHLQTNKTRAAAVVSSEFQALDSLRVAAALDRRLQELGRTLEVLVEVNSSGEESKWGLPASAVAAFAEEVTTYPRLVVRGLMTVAAAETARAAQSFYLMAELQESLLRSGVPGQWSELSMGMSADFETAISYGATCVRIGAAIFGERNYSG
ncbi:MAG: YggS family pyridoxal phosphate-dependent enzyme [Propionibacteriaceae bacterium]|nr:YggS family pyridoxal phosphate-dependent enzyme [Propionibacteriaceae bacterium]